MKKIRVLLISMAAPAAILLGLHEIGGTPVSKGYETGFEWRADPTNGQLILSAQPGGNMNCWIKLRVPAGPNKITARTEANVPLLVKIKREDRNDEWLEITKSSTEDFFDWQSGRNVIVQFEPKPPALIIEDWEAFLNNKNSDSKSWAQWRRGMFIVSLFLLLFALVGAVFEVLEKYGVKGETFTSQRCVEQMIEGFEGKNSEQSEQNRTFLRKLLLEGASIEEALAPLNLSRREQVALLSRISGPFRFKLNAHVDHLNRLSNRLRLF